MVIKEIQYGVAYTKSTQSPVVFKREIFHWAIEPLKKGDLFLGGMKRGGNPKSKDKES